MITELTPEQEAKFPDYVRKWVDIGLSTEPCDFEKSKEAVIECYQNAKLPPPEIFLGPLNHPYEAALAEHILSKWEGREFKDSEDLNTQIKKEIKRIIDSKEKISNLSFSNQIYGIQEFWLSSYDFFQNECGLDCDSKIGGLKKLSQVCGWWTPLQNIAIFQHRPLEIHRDSDNRIHNTEGAAVKFRGNDVCDVYAVHGVRVSKKIIDRDYTVNDIDNETNAEVRRVMVELYGQEKYLIDSKAEVVNEDDFGVLYRKTQPNDEDLMMVKVVNSTPESDGSFKDYFIRVDPNAYGGLKTAMSAVASTWRNRDGSMIFEKPEDYDPAIQT